MEKDVLEIKISYRDIQHIQTKKQITSTVKNEVSLNELLKKINRFIEEKQIDASEFLQIFINVKNQYKNIYHILQNQDSSQLQFPRINDKFHIHIELRDLENEEEKEYIPNWEKDIDNFIVQQTNIRNTIKEKQKTLEGENKNLIDLAFFYAEPLVFRWREKEKAQGKQVAFQKETVRFTSMLKAQGLQKDTHIHINVATQSNILKALASKITILHFSCHGDSENLLLQDEKNLGMLWSCSAQNLINLLSENLPNIIFFNACYSNLIAKKVYDAFKDEKTIITIGYEGKANDQECTKFTQLFYRQIFSDGISIVQSFKKARSQMTKNIDKLNIYYNNQISIKPSKYGSNVESYVAIENQHQPMEEDLFSINLQLYNFINEYFTSMNKEIILFNGEERSGKSLFVKKVCLYLKQRGRIDNHLIIDFRDTFDLHSSIGSIAEFRIECSEKIQKFIEDNENKNVIIVLDHCDSLMILQEKLFYEEVEKYLKNIRGKIILVFEKSSKGKWYPKQPFVLQFEVFKQFFIHKRQQIISKLNDHNKQYQSFNWNSALKTHGKKIKSQIYKPYLHLLALQYILLNNYGLDEYFLKLQSLKAEESQKIEREKLQVNKNITLNSKIIERFTQVYCQYLQNIIKSGGFIFSLTEHSIIDFMIEIKDKKQIDYLPTILPLKRTTSNTFSKIQEKIQEEFREKYKKILREIQYLIKHIDQSGITIQKILKTILRSINCLISFKYMIYKEVLHTQHKNVSSFVKVVEKCVNLCLILIHKLKENKRKKNMAIQFEILMQKLLLFLVITTKNDESWNYSLKKYSIYKQSLYEIVNDDTKKIIDSLLFLYEEFILKIEPDKIHDIDIESNVYRYDKIKLFYQKYLVLKKSFDKNFENILDSDLEYGQSDSFGDEQKIYGINELKQMGLVFVKLVKGYIKYRCEFLSFQEANSIKNMLSECQFLFTYNHNLEHFYEIKPYKRQYIYILFTLEKIVLKKPSEAKKYTRVQIVGKFSKWIQQCKIQNYKELESSIQRYKSESFNSCAALTSFPLAYKEQNIKESKNYEKKNGFLTSIDKNSYILINPFRFSLKIDEIIKTSFEKIKKNIFTRVDCLSEKTISKYKQDNLPILLAFFFVDCKNTQKQEECILFLEDPNGLSIPVKIQNLEFFHSYISVFCGNHVQKIQDYVEKYRKDDNTIYIFLNSSHKDLGDDPEWKFWQIYWSIRNKILIQTIFEHFIHAFCEEMFNEQHANFFTQINYAFNVGKENARIRTKMKYGVIFNELIEKFIENITIVNHENEVKKLQPPLKISQSEKKFKDEKTKQINDLRYNSQLIKTLQSIQKYKQKIQNSEGEQDIDILLELEDDFQVGTKFIIIYSPQKKTNKEFIDCLKAKIKKMGIFANGIVSEGQLHENNTGASSLRSRKVKLEDDVMQVYEDKTKQQIVGKIKQQTKISKQEGNKKDNRVVLFTTFEDQGQSYKQWTYIRLDRFSQYNIVVWALYELFLKMTTLKNNTQKKVVTGLINEVQSQMKSKGASKADKLHKSITKYLEKLK